MNRLIFNILAVILAVLFGTLVSYAQDDWGKEGDIEDAQIVVEKNKEINLPSANRKFEKIEIPKEEVTSMPLNYDGLTPVLMDLNQINPNLRILKVSGEEFKSLKGNYVEAGFGNYITPYLKGHFNSTQNPEYEYGAVVNHISSKNGPVDYSGMSSSELGVYGNYFLQNAVLKGEMFYNNDVFRYYGFNSEKVNINDENTIKQNLNNFSSKVGIDGGVNGFNYNIDGKFNTLSGKKGLSDLNYGYNSDYEYVIADNSSVILGSDLNIETAKYDSNQISRVYFSANPRYKFLHNGIHFTVGVNTAYDNDTITKDAGGFHIYPHAFANYPVFVNELNIFAGLTGGLENNTMTSFMNENQWYVMDVIPVFNNNKTLEVFGGLKGNFKQKLGYKTQLSIQNYKNLHFFVNNPLDSTSFTAVTDSGNTSVIQFSGELSYEIANRLLFGADLMYNQYSTSVLEAAFHRPTLEIGVNAQYNVKDKLYLKGNLGYFGGIKGYSVAKQEIVDLNDIIDLNIEIDYKFSDNFSSFVMLNNILSTEYQYYMNYPTKGFNAIIGVSYSF